MADKKVRLHEDWIGPSGPPGYKAGETVTLDEKTADKLVKEGKASHVPESPSAGGAEGWIGPS